MGKLVTLKPTDTEFRENALHALEGKLYTGEEVVWTGSPNSALFLIDLTYKAIMWWSMFVFIVPLAAGASTPELTAMMVVLLTYLEFKKQWNSRVFFITDTRAIYADKTRKGVWIFTDYPLSEFVSAKRSKGVKNLTMTFHTVRGDKALRFPYLADATEALALLHRPVESELAAVTSSQSGSV